MPVAISPVPEIVFASPLYFLVSERADFKVAYGGRGGAKTWSFARAALVHAMMAKKKILCVRELQASLADSVHATLKEQIWDLRLSPWFDVTQKEIRASNGSSFIFKGLRHNTGEIKSIEGVDICWVEEAQIVSRESWRTLLPTIRKKGAEIWINLNPLMEKDATYQDFIVNPQPESIIQKINWRDNPWFPEMLERQRVAMLQRDPDAYQHVWEGACLNHSAATIFRNRVSMEPFETPETGVRFHFGADWGFSVDPTAFMRCWIRDDELFVDREAFGFGTEIDNLPQLFDTIPGARRWPILADNARPETISYMARQGFNIRAAEKWKGSVEDGIEHLKGFKKIHIHPRYCPRMCEEARLYSYKVDKNTEEILPVVEDAHNHGWDALRYALDGYIHKRGTMDTWRKLAGVK